MAKAGRDILEMKTLSKSSSAVLWAIIAFFALLLFNLIFTKGFFLIEIKENHLFGTPIDILKRFSPILIVSIGMTLVIATKGIDISVGSVAAIAGSVAVLVLREGDITYLQETVHSTTSLFPIITLALGAAAICGLFNGFLVSFLDIQPIVATLILMITGRGIAVLLTGGYVLNFDHPHFEYIGSGYFLGFPLPFVIAIGVFLLVYLFTTITPFGLFLQATGGNPVASIYSGINVRLVKILAYLISGLCAGISGIILTADVKSADANYMGMWMELDAILSVVIGGTSMSGGRFNLFGTIVGALIIQTLITTILTKGVQVQFTLIVKSIVVIFVIIIQSERIRNYLRILRERKKIE